MTYLTNLALQPKSFSGFNSDGKTMPIRPVTAGTVLVVRISVWKTWTDETSKGFTITCGGTTLTIPGTPNANTWTITPTQDATEITFTALNDGKAWRADNVGVFTTDDWTKLQTLGLPKNCFNGDTMPLN
ncbi:hypothetical protein JS533_001755 [Bifidobacterium amazonense]|uniref:Uncharacterized protein n=1 Tax=Bifidobacterium amazonense TaxID=2809027 RepID=A0ABS9VSX1_9BIFI|nr:hypothetical protein [Bifidobacterium amazonense]MCH9275014.1 hypothetical protein [Bifidobacterium amazonense]